MMRMWMVFCLFSLCLGSFAFAADSPKIVDDYLEQLRSPSAGRRTDAAKRITGEMISERRLFDQIDQMLRENHALESPSATHIDEMAWLCKALASSGRPEYRETLQLVVDNAPSQKLKYYAQQSLEMIEDYAARNALVTQAVPDPELSREENQFLQMLSSKRWDLQRDAAKRILRAVRVHAKVYATVNETLLQRLDNTEWNNLSADAMAWMCKALGNSGKAEYRPTLEKVAALEGNPKLQVHARKALEMLR